MPKPEVQSTLLRINNKTDTDIIDIEVKGTDAYDWADDQPLKTLRVRILNTFTKYFRK